MRRVAVLVAEVALGLVLAAGGESRTSTVAVAGSAVDDEVVCAHEQESARAAPGAVEEERETRTDSLEALFSLLFLLVLVLVDVGLDVEELVAAATPSLLGEEGRRQ